MQAGSHLVTNLTLAIVTENLVPVAGAPIHWLNLASIPGFASPNNLAAKGIYYAIIVAAASLPDLDQRLRLCKHRTFTHSLVGIMCLVGALLGLRILIFSILIAQHLAVLPDEQLFGQMVVTALPLACIFHILGDLITIRGGALFWPRQVYVRLLPKKWAIKNRHQSEYLVVAALLCVVVGGIGLNILGI